MRHLSLIYRIASIVVFAIALLIVQLPSSQAAGVVTTCDEASLDTALAGGGTITFACSGTITVTSTKVISVDTTLDGSGQNVTISGGDTLQIFFVNDGVRFEVRYLTLSNGNATEEVNGAAIGSRNLGLTTIIAINSTFTQNHAASSVGGAIYGHVVNVNNSTFNQNSAERGGAIFGNYVNIYSSTFSHNSAFWSGGAIDVWILDLSNSMFTYNTASRGGAAYIYTGDIHSSAFVYNSASNLGDAIYLDHWPLRTENSGFLNNDCDGTIADVGGNLARNSPGCPGVDWDDAVEIAHPITSILIPTLPPPQCQEMLDPAFAAPVGTYCQVLMRNGAYIGYAGTIPGELVDAGVIIAIEIIYYDLPGHASQTFPDGGNQQVCLQGEGRFIYLNATQSPRQIVEMNSVYENGYTCAWIPNPGTVILIEG